MLRRLRRKWAERFEGFAEWCCVFDEDDEDDEDDVRAEDDAKGSPVTEPSPS